MLNLKQFKGFALVKGDTSVEANSLLLYSVLHDIPRKMIPKGVRCPEDFVPNGSVEWCLASLNKTCTPDYYPEWLLPHLHRRVWREDKWLLEPVFIKPADRYKRFNGFVTTGSYRKKKKPPFWCSTIVQFENEWRYYISHGKVLTSGWYSGDEINTPQSPPLNIEIPSSYCGAVDFGFLKTGEFALVEANHPFACGWYGKDTENYLQWLVDGWEYMLEKSS